MKRLFNHTKRTPEEWEGYDENDYDWDMEGAYESEEFGVYPDGEGEYYAEDELVYSDEANVGEYHADENGEYYTNENGEYYADENGEYYADENGEYYADENGEYYADENGEYYADENGEYYADENGEYYADENGQYYVDENGEYYVDESGEYYVDENGEYYMDENGEYYPADAGTYYEEEEAWYEEDAPKPKRSKGFWVILWHKFLKMGTMDRIITVTGISVLILALVTVGVYTSSKAIDEEMAQLADVGSQLEGIELIGEEGLLAVADAEIARQAAAELMEAEQEEQKEYDEEEYLNAVTVRLSMTSVMKDLKIKFINKDTGKLISNVPFSVTITDPDGKSVTWSDDDMDGIIYKKDIVGGTYKVLINELADEKYAGYTIPSTTQSVEVKKEIAYEKIDVSDEVMTEDEIDVSQEDTKINETVVESTLQDTVAWVESTAVSETYTEVSKSTIPDPMVSVAGQAPMSAANVPGVSGGDGGAAVITLDKTAATLYQEQSVAIIATLTNTLTNAAVSAESSDANVATVAVTDKTITVTGVAAGDATIMVKYIEDGKEAKAVCTVKVLAHPKNNTTDKLKDSAGNQLYVQENNAYREAVYADYYTAEKFFVKSGVKYTGWQTINGSLYYFTASGEKVTGEQIIQGAKYNFSSDGSLITGSGMLGIDVSKWNGNIDWQAVKNSGVSYVIIRCGYRGSTQGMLIEDPKFNANIKGALDAGLKVGVYFFTQATDEIEAVEEASYVLDKIKNYRISYPVFLDVEPSGGRGDKIDRATRTAVCKAFCETIQRAGYTAGIYANKTWLTDKMDIGSLGSYKIWLAQYAATPSYSGRYDMWQYTSKGKVSGIKGDVDLNLSYLGY